MTLFRILQKLIGAIIVGSLGACGTYVPDVQEFWATPGDTEIKVNLIAGQVKCELKQALNQLVHDNPRELI